MASTDITIQAVGEQLGSLRSMLATPRRLAHWPNMDGRSVDQLDQLVIAAVDGVFKQFWWLLSDTKLDGTKVADGRVQNRYYIDGAYDASLAFDALGEGFPMLDARYPGDSRNIWVFNTYCLALQLLGYRPAS